MEVGTIELYLMEIFKHKDLSKYKISLRNKHSKPNGNCMYEPL
jgi:hypothetical protein